MPRFCPSCGAQMTDTAAPCAACGKEAGQSGGSTPPAPAPGGGGLTDNVAGLLVYLIGILAIVFLLIEPYNKNKFIRFHCFQCLFFWAAYIVCFIVLMILSFVLAMIPVVGGIIAFLLWMVLWLGAVVVWILLMVKAYQNQMWKLPFIGDMAEKQANA